MLHAYLVGFFTYYCRKHKTLIINNLDLSFPDAEFLFSHTKSKMHTINN